MDYPPAVILFAALLVAAKSLEVKYKNMSYILERILVGSLFQQEKRPVRIRTHWKSAIYTLSSTLKKVKRGGTLSVWPTLRFTGPGFHPRY